jgi:hypothetical protein
LTRVHADLPLGPTGMANTVTIPKAWF